MLRRTKWLGLIYLSLLPWVSMADIIIPTLEEVVDNQRLEGHCASQAGSLLELQALNQQNQCGFKGGAWRQDKQAYYQQCMQVAEALSRYEDMQRISDVESCLKAKASLSNADNKLPLPEGCANENSKMVAVKRLFRWFRYNQTVISPIQNGLIEYDYNQDDKTDYVYIESDGKRAGVVICLSKGALYQRRETKMTFLAEGDDLNGYQYSLSQQDKQLHIDLQFFSHNIGESSNNSIFRYDVAKQDFVLVSRKVYAAGVEYDGVEAPMGAPELAFP